MNNEERIKQYEICKIRGHVKSGITRTSNPPWQVCKYCGTSFRFETKMIESDVPEAIESKHKN